MIIQTKVWNVFSDIADHEDEIGISYRNFEK